ncbi:MAG: hypothetical protein ACRD4Q_01525 [Candidatus Acidiferrales bacterium]
MSSDKTIDNFHLLGEQLEKLEIGSAGQRDDDGSITAIPEEEGFIFYGPYLTLPPGPYSVRMIFAAESSEDTMDNPGIVLEAVWGEEVIASFRLDEASLEAGIVALPFDVPEGGAVENPRLEIRVYSRGQFPLVVTSIDVRRLTSAFRRFAEYKTA